MNDSTPTRPKRDMGPHYYIDILLGIMIFETETEVNSFEFVLLALAKTQSILLTSFS